MRLIAGLLLALGPFFIAFLLFEGTRGLFEGWIRVLAGAALGALGTSIVLGVELALLEPWLAELIALPRRPAMPIPGAAIELFVVTLVFALVLLAMSDRRGAGRLGFRLPRRLARRRRPGWPRRCASERPRLAGLPREPAPPPADDRSRAAAVADAVAASQRREGRPPPAARTAGAGATASRRGGSRARAGARRARRRRAGAARPELSPPHASRDLRERRPPGSRLMNKQSREALDAYYVEAGQLGAGPAGGAAHVAPDRLDRSPDRAATVAVLLAIALIVLMPLKTVEPYTLLVDRQTGFVQALEPLDPERISPATRRSPSASSSNM